LSKISLSGNASGTGIFTIASPNGNTDRTLTLPDNTGTILTTATAGVPVNGPAFSAYQSSSQNVTSATWTKLNLQTEEFDTNACFDNSTNYRFTPTVAGYYQVVGCVAPNTIVTVIGAAIYKNGNPVSYAVGTRPSSQVDTQQVGKLIYMNGSTDYVELYCFVIGTSPTMNPLASTNYFQASLARSAT
jgi:hypothetical protein